MVRDLTAPPPVWIHTSVLKGMQSSSGPKRTKVLLTHILNASRVSNSAYAVLSKVRHDTASRDHSTGFPLSKNSVNKFELIIKHLKHSSETVSITVSTSLVGLGEPPLIAVIGKYGKHFKSHWLEKLPLGYWGGLYSF